MPLANPYSKYRQAAVSTADPGELLILTYEAILRWINRAKVAIQEERIGDAHEALLNAQTLVSNLSASLDDTRGPEIAENLRNIYEYVNDRLLWANLQKDASILDTVSELLRPLLEAWRSAVTQTRRSGILPAIATN